MEPKQIASFVVRFQLVAVEKETGKKQWRIKVTHVQEERETLFDTIEEATAFMMSMVEDT
ncbi:hypothetical protein [Bacillus sp. 7884-1]|uniref:hypothetical protein n=1 Tax=Bacillus sp. 7884-1 TaxID=2021693 RepID=UPI000BA7C2ED|nr:hypothetical protein [Bacillus sp. 7884-1]PAE42957.1 hypothetical protein CHI06_08970 [Bacillus sp. 7884-1]